MLKTLEKSKNLILTVVSVLFRFQTVTLLKQVYDGIFNFSPTMISKLQ